MFDLSAFFGQIAQLTIPAQIIYSYQKGVRWTLGKNPRILEPGIHWKIWGIHEIIRITSVQEVVDLPVASVTTSDDVQVCYSANIGIRVTDPVAHLCNVTNFAEAMKAMSVVHLSGRVRGMTWAQLHDINEIKKLEKSLRETLETKIKGWGTEILHVGFTDLVKVRNQVRLFQDTWPRSVL